MTPEQYVELTYKVDSLIVEFGMQEALDFSVVCTAMRAYMDRDSIHLWLQKDGKTPVIDKRCHCSMPGKHYDSHHGANDEWEAKHFWYRKE